MSEHETRDKTTRPADAAWVVALASLGVVVLLIIAIWGLSSGGASPRHAGHTGIAGQPMAAAPQGDFFSNYGNYMPRSHCLMNQAGQPDWPWIIALIVLNLGVIAAYLRIYIFWCRSYFAEKRNDRNRKLMDLAQIFLWCAVCGYVASVVIFFWPGYRAVALCLLMLNLWSWKFSWNLNSFRVSFSANRYRRMAEEDGLTGLANRTAAIQQIEQQLRQIDAGESRGVAVLFLDFDRFKIINDTLGHDAGDALLVSIASRLRDTLDDVSPESHSQIAGRIGGDEFIVVLGDLPSIEDADAVADRLQGALAPAYQLSGKTMHSSASIGIAWTDDPAMNADGLIRNADIAMYEAKARGRGCRVFFDEQMSQAVFERAALEADLRVALERDEFLVFYQPIVRLDDGEVSGFEALVRWRHPTRGLVPPDKFVAIAEEIGVIHELGFWVFEQACQQLVAWRDRFDPELKMNINVSQRQLTDPDLAERFLAVTQKLSLPASAVSIEITESTIVTGAGDAVRALRDKGFRLSMDDFGTGYSSLACLHEFPLDVLKIDRAFIANLEGRRDYAAVIHAIASLARNLGFQVTAEGIESMDMVAELQALDCHFGQGYFFHKPAEPDIIAAYLDGRRPMPCAG
ncbi:MAG: putative bifunctional diguanylate cyclase/phosphodiesterase [Phycisphaerales bacterium JB063]